MSDEATYTLAEARRELARRECAHHGHSWQIVTTFNGCPVGIVCDSCGWTGSVEMGDRKP